MKFILEGRVYPYVRMTRRSKYKNKYAQRYLANQGDLKWQFKQQMLENGYEMFPARTPLSVEIEFQIARNMHNEDIDNLTKAVLDAAQHIVYKNDLWVDEIHVYRRKSLDYKCTVRMGRRPE